MIGDKEKGLRATSKLIIINIIIFILGIFSLFGPKSLGINPDSILIMHQWYRLFTNMFCHFGVLHLLCNMYALWSIGMVIEPMIGTKNFYVLYLGSGLLGSIFVLIISHILDMSILAAGASGAIFGLLGFLLHFSIRMKGVGGAIVKSVIITLILSSLGGGSLMCHLCGLVAGFIIAPFVTSKS